MSNYYYITTTLPYVNADPHIGFALEIVQADVLARYYQALGKKVFFNTGTDEHGQKIYQKALQNHQDPQTYCDTYAAKFNLLKQKLNLSYNSFIRTTQESHIRAAQHFWNLCLQKEDIYKANQEIKYCVGCEMEKTDSELIDGKCSLHPNQDLEIRLEENYFFRFSNYQDKLIELYQDNKNLVIPQFRQEEIKNFVESNLQDFSVSRLKTKMPWGIPVPNDPDHVMYVWFDALINYISSLGWPENNPNFTNYWGTIDQPRAVQVAGKDNLRQQAAIWQAMLMSAGLPNSKQIFIHGFVTSSGVKMSKSLGNVVNPFDIVDKYGHDALRYYLLKEIHPYNDSDFTQARFIDIYNSDLANGLGNLVQRVTKMCEQNDVSLAYHQDYCHKQSQHLNNYAFHLAIQDIWKLISETDKKVNDQKPWQLDTIKAKQILTELAQDILSIAWRLQIFLPDTADKIIKIFTSEKILAPEAPLFPRINN